MALITLPGWGLSLGGVGVIVLATAILVYVFVRDSPSDRGLPSLAEIDGLPRFSGASPPMPLGHSVLVVLRVPNTWLLGSYAFLLFGTMTMMQGLWAVPYLMDVYGRTRLEAANALTLWAVGLIVGCTLWGYVADKIARSRKRVALAGAVVYALLWVLLASRPATLPAGTVWVFFWPGGAVYQQISRLMLAQFPKVNGHTPAGGYQAVFWLRLGSVGLSVILVALSQERRPVPSVQT